MAYRAPSPKLRTDHRLPSQGSVSRQTEMVNPYNATLPLIPVLPPLVNPLSPKYDSKLLMRLLLSPSPISLPRTHERCTTCRHRNNITSPRKLPCIGLLHIGHSVFAMGQFSTQTQNKGGYIPVKRNPLPCPFCNLPVKSVQSPAKIAPQPSNKEICKWKSCKILINASFSPGISNPFLILRRSRMGDISTPTFSKSPLMKVGRVSEYLSRSSQRSSSACSLANSMA